MVPDAFRSAPKTGSIEVICGCMFSGKTEELIRRLKRAHIARQKVLILKHSLDTRYDENSLVSHNEQTFSAIPVSASEEILVLSEKYMPDVVGIDEVQFFDMDIVRVARILAGKGIRVILAGLDMDYKGNPFGATPFLMAIAEYVTKLHAVCVVSGEPASFTFRREGEKTEGNIQVGASEIYEPRSRRYFEYHD